MMLRILRGVRDNFSNLTQPQQQNPDPNSTGVTTMSTWQEDPELFLYKSHKKGSQLHIWRCKKMSSSMPLTRGDFTDEIPVPDFRSLVKKGYEWSKSYMEVLEKYICPKHFLVNCEGLVYVELFKFSECEKMDDNDDRIYLRLYDVLDMEAYGIKNPKVSFRTFEYIEGGEPASVDPSPNELKLAADLTERTSQLKASQKELEIEKSDKEALEIKVAKLEAGVTCLKDKETTLSAELDTQNCEVLDQAEKKDKRTLEEKFAEVENKNKILVDNEKKLTVSLEAKVKEVENLQQDLKKEKSDRQELEIRVASLEATVKAILAATKKTPKGEEETKTTASDDLDHGTCVVQPLQQELNQANDDKGALEEQVAGGLESKNDTLTTNQTKLNEIEKEEAWMSDYICDDWVGFEKLQVKFERKKPPLRITKEGASFSDDNTTNVKPDNFYLVFSGNRDYPAKVVNTGDLAPNGEKARYDPNVWGLLDNAGEKYAARFKDDE